MLHDSMTDAPTAHDQEEPPSNEVEARYLACRSGDASAARRMDFMRWSAETPERRRDVRELQRLDADLDALRDLYAAETERLARAPRRRALGWAGGLAAGIAALALAFLSLGSRTVTASDGVPVDLALWDGSHVHLDAGARAEIPFAPWARRAVLLSGDALFEIVHDDRRPFSVAVGRAVIKDRGTRFLIQAEQAGMRVAVYEGAVEIGPDTDAPPHDLAARQAATVSADGTVRAAPLPDEARATAWSRGRLIFDDTPLAEAAERLSRYWGNKVVADSPAVADLRITGSFELNNQAGLLRAIELTLPVAVRRNGGEIVLIQAPPREAVAPSLLLPQNDRPKKN